MGTDTDLPVGLATWLASAVPLVVLLVLLVWRRWSSAAAAPIALATSVAVAVLLLAVPPRTIAVAAGKGIWDAIFVLYVIWPALVLYHIANEAGSFDAIQRGIRRLMPDTLLVVLAFSWVLSSFIQGVAGFGTPLAVTAPLLLGLGVRPLYAVLLPLIGAAWANMFGSLGAGWLATTTVVDLPSQQATLISATALLWVPNLTAGLTIAWLYGRGWALRRAWPAILVLSTIQGGGQMLLVPLIPPIGNFLANSAALAAVFVLNQWSFYRQHDEDEPDLIFSKRQSENGVPGGQAGETKAERDTGSESPAGKAGESERGADRKQPMPLWFAFAPYLFLGALALLVLLVPPVNDAAGQFGVGLPFPATSTGFGVEREATEAYAAFTPLTHPGTFLLVSGLFGYGLYRSRGLYHGRATVRRVLGSAAEDALPATTAVTALLLTSKVMDHSGQITVLALGVSAVAPSLAYVATSNFIGLLGSFITSSNTASNILFAPLQATAATAEGLPVDLAVAAQSAGAATGNAISPGDTLLGATVAGIPDRLGMILARAMPWALATAALIAVATVAIYLLFY